MNSAERRFALFLLVALLAVDAILIAATAASWASLDPDFFGIWSTAKFLQSHQAAEVYDVIALGAFQHSLRPHFTAVYPAPYSPVFLLVIARWPGCPMARRICSGPGPRWRRFLAPAGPCCAGWIFLLSSCWPR